MHKEMAKQISYEKEILELIDDRDDYTRSDLQALVTAVVMKIMRESKTAREEVKA